MNYLKKTGNWLVLPGGSDICPSLYGKENFVSYVSEYSRNRDKKEVETYYKAVKEGRPVFGICRGLIEVAHIKQGELLESLK